MLALRESSEAVLAQQEREAGAVGVTGVGSGLNCDIRMPAKIIETMKIRCFLPALSPEI